MKHLVKITALPHTASFDVGGFTAALLGILSYLKPLIDSFGKEV